MRLLVVLAALIFLTAACQRSVYVPVESGRYRSDSTAAATFRVDSVLRSDSVIIFLNGDTLISREVHNYHHYKTTHDTLTHVITDSVSVPVIVEVPAKLGAFDRFKLDTWPWFTLALMLAFAMLRSRRSSK